MDVASPDVSYDSKVDEIHRVFPDKSEIKIRDALESANGDLHEACVILLSETTAEETTQVYQPDPLDDLKVMFPNVDAETIKNVYQRCGSIEAATSELLSLPLLSLIDDEEQKNAERQLKNGDCRTEGPSEKTGWKKNSDKIKVIRQYTSVSDSAARQAFHESSLSVVKAIIQLVWNQDHYGNSRDETKADNLKEATVGVRAPKGGRVQAGTGFAHATKNRFEIFGPKDTADDTTVNDTQEPYVYSDSTEEAQELRDILRSNAGLRTINLAFLKRALAFYRGNIQQTMSLALFILEANGAKATCKSAQTVVDPKDILNFTVAPKSQITKTVAAPAPVINATQLTPRAFQNDDHYNEGRRMIQNVFTNTRLDFHGFVPNDAIQVLRSCLHKWWSQEKREREMNSQNLSIGKAMNVAPLEIVTGRGIHSAGGVSVLKIKVRKFLNDNHYLYWEEPAYFVVQGRKSRGL